MSNTQNYVNEFALRTLVRFLRDEQVDALSILEKNKAKVLGNNLGYDDGLGPIDKTEAIDLIRNTILNEAVKK